MSRKVLIIDGNNLAHRAYHKYSNMRATDGTPSSVTFGFPYILRSLLGIHKPAEVLVVFDGGRDKNRKKVWPEYKDRERRPDFDYKDFQKQKKDTKKILKYLGIAYSEIKGTEADDIIWLYTRRYARMGNMVVIVSTDKDFNQLISPKVSLWNPFKNLRITHKNIEQQYGYTPQQCVDYLILDGDNSDNIPGYPKVGKKRAMGFIENYGSIKAYLIGNQPEDKLIKRKELEEVFLRNRQLIDIRLHCRRYFKGFDYSITNPSKGKLDHRKLSLICSDYSISTFIRDDFTKHFEKLLK